MNLIDRVLLEWSFKTKNGYPDINSEEDLSLFESMFGFDPTLSELKKLDYDILTPVAKEIAQELIKLLGIEQSQIIPQSKSGIVIYSPSREELFDKIQDSGKFGKATRIRSGNWKKDGVTIIVKPTGEKAGEYFELKPQQLGLTLDKKISLSQLKQELIRGVKSHKVLNSAQINALLYALTDIGAISDSDREELPNGFFNEVNKNFGEPHGALLYGLENGYDSVEFPAAGNYPLIDYILYKGEERTQVSAKTAKGMGNTVKYKDVIKLVSLGGGEVPIKIGKFNNIINSNSVIAGAFEAIDEFGSTELKKAVQDYKIKYPDYPKIGSTPEDRQAHADRIAIEKAFVKDINNDTDLNFNELFNNFVQVKYIKYRLNDQTLKGEFSEIVSGEFNVKHHSKNSPGHDSDKLGLAVSKAK
tara:strand:- start:4242 stop:5489 length:1248 start_codon:yes stop_codon:yes gene_type:complete